MRRWHLRKLKPVVLLLLVLMGNGGVASEELIVSPGKGVGSIVINDTIDLVLKRFSGESFIKTVHKKGQGFFRDVFKIEVQRDVVFDEIYFYRERSLAVFCLERRIRAVVLSEPSGMLSNGMSLRKGIALVMFNLGNEGLSVYRRDSDVLYVFDLRGVAFFDDGGDDSIEMTAVFPSSEL